MWTMDDYPDTWKHFEPLERKKAIDIANAMLKEGYKESDLIPIATAQAKKWYQSASQEELKELKNKKLRFIMTRVRAIQNLWIMM